MKARNRTPYFIVVFLIIVIICIVFLWNNITGFSNQFKDTGVWEMLSALASIIAVSFAFVATLQARRTIEISNMEFVIQKTPALLFSQLENTQLDVLSSDSEFRFHLGLTNHGSSIALLRQIKSEDDRIQYNFAPPISLGIGESTNICIIHNSKEITGILKEFESMEEGIYPKGAWSISVDHSKLENTKLVKMTRNIAFSIFYWNVYGNCYKYEAEFTIVLIHHLNWYVGCFVNSELNQPFPDYDKNMPKAISNYSSL